VQLVRSAGMEKINFSGGEPFLPMRGRHLGEMMKYCKTVLKLPSVSVVSNGSLITEKWFQTYGSYVDIMAVSCDSFDEDTNKVNPKMRVSHLLTWLLRRSVEDKATRTTSRRSYKWVTGAANTTSSSSSTQSSTPTTKTKTCPSKSAPSIQSGKARIFANHPLIVLAGGRSSSACSSRARMQVPTLSGTPNGFTSTTTLSSDSWTGTETSTVWSQSPTPKCRTVT
jgi:hypothetical protein